MPSGTHCWTHDVWYHGECPRCIAEESVRLQREAGERREQELEEARDREEERRRDQERRHEELIDLREREIYERSNPGEFECPECLLVSLKRRAKRCPMCQAAIGTDYWDRVSEAERLKRERVAAEEQRKKAEWERGRPERERRAAEAASRARAVLIGKVLGVMSLVLFAVAYVSYTSLQTAGRSAAEARRGIVGRWYDGGPNCADLTERGDVAVLRVWYCEVGIENAASLTLRQSGETYADAAGVVTVSLSRGDTLEIVLHASLRDRIGNEYFHPGVWKPTFSRQ